MIVESVHFIAVVSGALAVVLQSFQHEQEQEHERGAKGANDLPEESEEGEVEASGVENPILQCLTGAMILSPAV